MRLIFINYRIVSISRGLDMYSSSVKQEKSMELRDQTKRLIESPENQGFPVLDLLVFFGPPVILGRFLGNSVVTDASPSWSTSIAAAESVAVSGAEARVEDP